MAEQAVAMENMEEAEEFLKTETIELYKKLLATIEESKWKQTINYRTGHCQCLILCLSMSIHIPL